MNNMINKGVTIIIVTLHLYSI